METWLQEILQKSSLHCGRCQSGRAPSLHSLCARMNWIFHLLRKCSTSTQHIQTQIRLCTKFHDTSCQSSEKPASIVDNVRAAISGANAFRSIACPVPFVVCTRNSFTHSVSKECPRMLNHSWHTTPGASGRADWSLHNMRDKRSRASEEIPMQWFKSMGRGLCTSTLNWSNLPLDSNRIHPSSWVDKDMEACRRLAARTGSRPWTKCPPCRSSSFCTWFHPS